MRRPQLIFGIIGVAATAVIFLILSFTTTWHWLIAWMVSASIIAFIFYGADKAMSKTGRLRIPENVLHIMSLIGGFLGALLGMLVFRHKTNYRAHPLFLPVILISAILYAGLIFLLFFRSA